MRTLLTAIVTVLVLTAGAAYAGIVTDPAQGALRMTLFVDAGGNATLTKNTLYDADPSLNMDSYEIWSSGGNLDPTNGTGWRSIADWVAIDPLGVIAKLGAGALTFGELSATTSLLAEGNLSSHAVCQANDPFSIGKPVQAGTPLNDLSFYYTRPGVVGDKFLGLVVPEPVTVSVLAAGGALALLRRRRRF